MSVTEPDISDTRRQPLWQPPRQRPSLAKRLLGVVVGIGLILIVVLMADPNIEQNYLSTAPVAVRVTVLRVESIAAPNDGPPVFRHVVELADGREGRFEAPQRFPPGTRLSLMLSRSRLTTQWHLAGPYRVVDTAE